MKRKRISDKQRLDWLSKNHPFSSPIDLSCNCVCANTFERFSVRKAIDAAIRAKQGGEEK